MNATVDAIKTANPLDFTLFAQIRIDDERMYLLADLGKNRYLVLRNVEHVRFSPTAQRTLRDLLPGYDAASWEITES